MFFFLTLCSAPSLRLFFRGSQPRGTKRDGGFCRLSPWVRGTRRAFPGDPVDDVGGDDLEPSAGAGHQRERGEAVESAGYALRALVEAAQGAWGEGRLVAAGGGELGGQVAR